MSCEFRHRLRRIELLYDSPTAKAIHEAQIRLQAGEDPGDGRAADKARRFAAALVLLEAATAPPAPA